MIAINTKRATQNFPNQSAYVAGKRGMDGVLRVLAREVGQHQVTVNQVAQGWLMCEAASSHGDDEAYIQQVPLKRRGTDQDVANLVTFLASDLAGFISGQYISVSTKCDADHIIEPGVRSLLFFGTIARDDTSICWIDSLDFVLPDADLNALLEVTSYKPGWFNKYLWKRH